jgi:hypothetical protein
MINIPKVDDKSDTYKICGLSPQYKFTIYGLIKRFKIDNELIYIEEGIIYEKAIEEKSNSLKLPSIEPEDIEAITVTPNTLVLYRDNLYNPNLLIINSLRKQDNQWVGNLEGNVTIKGLDLTKERAIETIKLILRPAPYYYQRYEGKEYALPFEDGYYKWSKAIEI